MSRPLSRRAALTVLGGVAALPLIAWAEKGPGYQVAAWPSQLPTPALDAVDLKGRPVRLADFRGRTVLLNFWATWCPPCRAEMPTLQTVPELLGEDRVVVLALNYMEAGRTARRFVESSGLRLTALLDTSGQITKDWGVRAFPTTVLIDRQGRARQVVQGEVDWSSSVALDWVEKVMALP